MTSPSNEQEPHSGAAYRWYHKYAAVLFAIFCFELGVFLLVFPWLDSWERNYFATWRPELQRVWMNAYFRGAISGLGLVNIFIAFLEILRLRRFASP
ncbi:MAG: hypothetical protein NZV14_16225 [Bryobacteraceae bacterium]|nr:hypothetical protein [Bryobacteraceae bacterium]MDW8379709.1 hypothetical protein [Bryobacterales bacterium]